MNASLTESVRREYLTKLILTTFFLAAFVLYVLWMFVWRPGAAGFILSPFDLALLGFATFRLGRMVAWDRVTEPLRYPFARTVPDGTGAGESVEPRGEGARQALGQLISCPICSGTWIAAGLVYFLYAWPGPAHVFLAILAAVGAAELLNSFTEATCWVGQYARTLTGEKEIARRAQSPQAASQAQREAEWKVQEAQNNGGQTAHR